MYATKLDMSKHNPVKTHALSSKNPIRVAPPCQPLKPKGLPSRAVTQTWPSEDAPRRADARRLPESSPSGGHNRAIHRLAHRSAICDLPWSSYLGVLWGSSWGPLGDHQTAVLEYEVHDDSALGIAHSSCPLRHAQSTY